MLQMATYTKESLNKLYNKCLIPIVLCLEKKLDGANNSKTELLDEIGKRNDKFVNVNLMYVLRKMLTTYFQADLLTSNVNTGENTQRPRRECLGIVGIPTEVKDETLQESVVGIVHKLGCSVDVDRIKACRRVRKHSNTVIFKFTSRKDCQKVWNKKKN